MNTARPRDFAGTARWWRVAVAISCLGLWGATRGCAWQGWWRPVRIDGGSMAETWLGPHYELSCDDCGYCFRFGTEHAPHDFVTCPNCGRVNDVDRAEQRLGERVLIDGAARSRRGVVVAFRSPDGELAAKRIVGLPGEHIAIADGDVWVTGQWDRLPACHSREERQAGSLSHVTGHERPRRRWQKSFREFLETAIRVHDDAYRPGAKTAGLPARWQPEVEPSGWRVTPEGYEWQAGMPGESRQELAWLGYRHWACYPTPQRRCETTPIRDLDSFNPTRSRTLFPVTDLMLTLDVWRDEPATVAVRYAVGERVETVLLSPRETIVPGVARTSHVLPARRWVRLAIAIFDGRIVVAFDGRNELQAELPGDLARPGNPTRSVAPWRIGAGQGTVRTRQLRIYRDLYYLDPFGQGKPWTTQLGPNEFCLLGDNIPLSRDSRHWAHAGLPTDQVLGPIRPKGSGK